MRVGIFGGTFNPVHLGHLTVAGALIEKNSIEWSIDRLVVVPSANPPHKTAMKMVSAEHRLSMVRLAFRDIDHVTVSDTEIRRGGMSFSIDTVRVLKQPQPDAEWRFIIGIDAFLKINTWKSWKALFQEIGFMVMTRPGHGETKASALSAQIDTFLKTQVDAGYTHDKKKGCFRHPHLKPVEPVAVPAIDIASSDIRKKYRRREPVADWLPPAVHDYIETKGLYL